ncbi:hypothetical protein GW17_00025491 [Ensete ventricosum]|nr:hypothetical protein GW17_00025491 [Ensete ventricosum]
MAIPSDSEGGPNPKPVGVKDKDDGEAAPEDTTIGLGREGGGEGEEDEDEDEDEIGEDEEEEDGDEEAEENVTPSSERKNLDRLLRRLSGGPVRLRVHDVIIRGNTKTKEALIESEVLDAFRTASSMQELLQAAGLANARLRQLDIFDSVNITLDSGPSELPGTANVVIDIVEAKNPLTGDCGVYSKPEVIDAYMKRSLPSQAMKETLLREKPNHERNKSSFYIILSPREILFIDDHRGSFLKVFNKIPQSPAGLEPVLVERTRGESRGGVAAHNQPIDILVSSCQPVQALVFDPSSKSEASTVS